MAAILHKLGYVRKGHLVSGTRDDLVGQYIGHTAPKIKEILKRAMGGVLVIDEAYYLYGRKTSVTTVRKAIEILLQVIENRSKGAAYGGIIRTIILEFPRISLHFRSEERRVGKECGC